MPVLWSVWLRFLRKDGLSGDDEYVYTAYPKLDKGFALLMERLHST